MLSPVERGNLLKPALPARSLPSPSSLADQLPFWLTHYFFRYIITHYNIIIEFIRLETILCLSSILSICTEPLYVKLELFSHEIALFLLSLCLSGALCFYRLYRAWYQEQFFLLSYMLKGSFFPSLFQMFVLIQSDRGTW